MTNYLRGHEIEFVAGEWIYSDNKEPTVNNERDCGFCGLRNTDEGHDGCLGTLPGIMNACCGHGNVKEAYLQYWDGTCIRSKKAKEIMRKLREEK